MRDLDLIASLYPLDDSGFDYATQTVANSAAHYTSPQHSSSPLESLGFLNDDSSELAVPYLQLRLSRGPKTPAGFVLGTDPNCDIVLPRLPGICFHHCVITFDGKQRLVLRHLGSKSGTSVSYDGEGSSHPRSDFTWMLDPDSLPWVTKQIILILREDLKFRIIIHCRSIGLEGNKNYLPTPTTPAGNAGTGSTSAHVQSRHHNARAIILKRKVGEGPFGSIVSHAWDVSTAEQWAIKEPSEKALRSGWVDGQAWERAARFMSSLSHEHIVRFIGSSTKPIELWVEFVPGMSLRESSPLSRRDCVEVLGQVSSALAYLHQGLSRPIVHRDIKPENILIHDRTENSIFVKLADFGLSKKGHDLQMQCGTLRYIAPEIYEIEGERGEPTTWKQYRPAADVWSLGVVLMELIIGPPSNEQYGPQWCEATRITWRNAFDSRNPLKVILDEMLQILPEDRASAAWCSNEAKDLLRILKFNPQALITPPVSMNNSPIPRTIKRKRSTLTKLDDEDRWDGGAKHRQLVSGGEAMDLS